jgi:hypothetical protein
MHLCLITVLFSSSLALYADQVPALGGDYQIVGRGPNSRVWQKTDFRTNSAGIVRTNVRSFTELHTGVCYQSNGEWADSVEQIELTATGAQALQSAHKVQWAANINTPTGAVKLTSPTGQLFSSTVYGLSYRDASTGTNVLIAPLQDSAGEVVGENKAVYTNAFSGVNADIEYTYTTEGLEQNIVLREQPPSPADYNLDPETTYFDVVTKFFDAPQATANTVTSARVTDDQIIRFNDMIMAQGTAFLIGDESQNQEYGFTVTKHWVPQADGSAFLFEEVPYTALTNLTTPLPLHSSNIKPSKQIRRTASAKPRSQKPSASASFRGTMKTARNDTRANKKPGFAIDYVMVGGGNDNTSSNFVFQGDTTYYVSGKWYFYGAPGTIVFEGGAVIKYTNSATIFNCGTSPGMFEGTTYRPTVFTAWNDNSVGDALTSSPGTLTWVNLSTCYVEEAGGGRSTNVVNNARFSYDMYA